MQHAQVKKSTPGILRIFPDLPLMHLSRANCLADTVGTVATIAVVVVLLGLLVVVVGTGVGDANIIDTRGGGVGDRARVTVVGVDTCQILCQPDFNETGE